MNLGWKEMKRNKGRFLIVGSIVFLISFMTLMISGLANGLSKDNAGLIQAMPDGQFYLTEDAKENYLLSTIDEGSEKGTAFSIQMGSLFDPNGKQQGVAFLTASPSAVFPAVQKGDVFLDRSLAKEGIQIGDTLTNNGLSGTLRVAGFVDDSKFSHAPVAFIHSADYEDMFQTNNRQILFSMNSAAEQLDGLQAFSKNEFLQTIESYKAEQLSLTMIISFLIIISGLLFGIFFYMMNIQKIGLYGILKAMGVSSRTLLRMIWSQMAVVTGTALLLSILASQLFNQLVPQEVPFHLSAANTLWLSGVFFIIGFLGASLSGVQIKKAEPLKAIQQGEN